MSHFPKFERLGPNVSRMRLSALARYEAERDGIEPPVFDAAHERFLSPAEVANRYGVSRATVWRWCRESRAEATK